MNRGRSHPPGFRVELVGVGEVHAPFIKEAAWTSPTLCTAFLEVHLEAELQDSGRIRSSDGSEGAGAKSCAGVGDAGAVAVYGAARVGVIGVVEAVEALGTGFELQSLMQRDEFDESRVYVGVVRPVELIGPGEAIRSSRVCGKG
jgi:hypothetical protein